MSSAGHLHVMVMRDGAGSLATQPLGSGTGDEPLEPAEAHQAVV